MTQSNMLFNIVKGPAKWDLITAFGNAHAGQTIDFQYYGSSSRIRIQLKVVINDLRHEDNSGESWNFKGYANMPNGKDEYIAGYYSSHGRMGHFRIVP